MFELYKNEIRRLKLWIIIPALAYLLLNCTSIYFGEYARSGLMIGSVYSVFFALVSLLLGLVQFHVYKKNSRWVYLINRPVSNTSLCLTLITAGVSITLFQFVITDLLTTLMMDSMSHYVIEKRHYYQVFYIFFVSMAFYLTGVYIQLCHSKGAFLVVILPIFAIVSLLFGGSAIIVSMTVALWMILLVLSVFKANVNNNQTSLWGKFLAIIPYQLGLFFIIGTVFLFVIQLKYMLIDGAGIDVPWNEYFADDFLHHVAYVDGSKKLALSLQEADKSIQQRYESQVKKIKTVAISPEIKSFLSQSLLPYQQKIHQLNIIDSINNEEWVFSLDQMLFINQKKYLNEERKLGLTSENGQVKSFKTIPTLRTHFESRQIITEKEVYFYDVDFQKLNLRVSISNDETLLSGLYQTGSLMSLITTKNIYLFNTNNVKNSSKLLIPDTIIEIPGAHENLSQVDLAEMIDSTLVSLLFGRNSSTGLFPAQQITIEVDSSTNKIRTLATRPLKHDFSEVYYQMDWAISPMTKWYYQDLIKPWLNTDTIKPESPRVQVILSNKIKMLILIITLSSVLLTFLCSKKRSKTTIERWSWIALTCLTSVTGFFVFLLLSDKHIELKQIKIKEKT